jgi:hypothetical protein
LPNVWSIIDGENIDDDTCRGRLEFLGGRDFLGLVFDARVDLEEWCEFVVGIRVGVLRRPVDDAALSIGDFIADLDELGGGVGVGGSRASSEELRIVLVQCSGTSENRLSFLVEFVNDLGDVQFEKIFVRIGGFEGNFGRSVLVQSNRQHFSDWWSVVLGDVDVDADLVGIGASIGDGEFQEIGESTSVRVGGVVDSVEEIVGGGADSVDQISRDEFAGRSSVDHDVLYQVQVSAGWESDDLRKSLEQITESSSVQSNKNGFSFLDFVLGDGGESGRTIGKYIFDFGGTISGHLEYSCGGCSRSGKSLCWDQESSKNGRSQTVHLP